MNTDAAETAAWLLRALAPDLPEPEREYRFDTERRWRFDFAWPLYAVALEVNGGRYTFAGGRHASDNDYAKMRRAAALGWRVLPCSPQELRNNPAAVVDDLRAALGLNDPAALPFDEPPPPAEV